MSLNTYLVEINEKKDPDPFITLFSKSKGNKLEFIAFRILKTLRLIVKELLDPDGDGGIDIFRNFEGYLILVQCKNYTDAKVGVDDIRKFEGMMSRYPNRTTIGIYVIFNTNEYSRRAETSELNILLTNVSSMKLDIINYVIEKLGNAFDDSEEPHDYELTKKVVRWLSCKAHDHELSKRAVCWLSCKAHGHKLSKRAACWLSYKAHDHKLFKRRPVG
ncbi:98_t:CDS:2 [Racocetra persica]|uniref:98_t:CDS:1 n=1 Tax=Racocetra persica TaxID=160502 RepID=A0ACA9MXF5_9GLOM|nr:98_t:CDS:2 [Racocetra persica]